MKGSIKMAKLELALKSLNETKETLVESAIKHLKVEADTVTERMAVWISKTTFEIPFGDYKKYARLSIKYIKDKNVELTRAQDIWFVEEIIRAAYSYVTKDHETANEFVRKTYDEYDEWINGKIDVSDDT